MQEEYDIAVDWRGFELHPETPEGGVGIERLFGADRVAPMRQYMDRVCQPYSCREAHTSDGDSVPGCEQYCREAWGS